MLQVGNLPDILQDKIHFSLWCILASPLMAGNDLSSMSDDIRNILTAPEVIAVNQDVRGLQGYKVYEEGNRQIYNKPLSDGTTAVLLLNMGEDTTDIKVTWEMVGLSGKQKVRDLWERKDLGEFNDSFTAGKLSKNGHMLIKIGTPGGKIIPGPSPLPLEKYTVTRNGTTWLTELYYIMKSGDAPRYDKNFNGDAISINGTSYGTGLGCRGSSRIMFKINGKADRFIAVVGPDDSYKGNESSRFRVLNEDFFGNQVLFDSGKVKPGSSVNIDINVKGVKYLLLMFDGEDTYGVWADAKVISPQK
jgi:alpha-galactosidase